MSSFFEEKKEEVKEYLPPNYSEDPGGPEDDDDDDDEEYSESDIDEGEAESVLDKQSKLNEKIMTTTPFGQPVGTGNTTGGWTGPSSTPFTPGFGQGTSSPWGQRPATSPWNPGGSPFGQQKINNNQQNQQINRKKRIIFCDFLDCMVETWDSNGRPGYLPRDIYDLKPRFEVWAKISAFNPEFVYAMIPINLIPNTNGAPGWVKTLEYFCCSLSSYLQLPWDSCKILAQSVIGQDKSELMESILVDQRGIVKVNREDAIYIGIYSGLAGQSNRDQVAAQKCNIDYVDLGILLNNMY